MFSLDSVGVKGAVCDKVKIKYINEEKNTV